MLMKAKTYCQYKTTLFNQLKNGEWFVFKDDPYTIRLKLDPNHYYILTNQGAFEKNPINDTGKFVIPIQCKLPPYQTMYSKFQDLKNGDIFIVVNNYGSPSLRVKLDILKAYNFEHNFIYTPIADMPVLNVIQDNNITFTFHLKEGE